MLRHLVDSSFWWTEDDSYSVGGEKVGLPQCVDDCKPGLHATSQWIKQLNKIKQNPSGKECKSLDDTQNPNN